MSNTAAEYDNLFDNYLRKIFSNSNCVIFSLAEQTPSQTILHKAVQENLVSMDLSRRGGNVFYALEIAQQKRLFPDRFERKLQA